MATTHTVQCELKRQKKKKTLTLFPHKIKTPYIQKIYNSSNESLIKSLHGTWKCFEEINYEFHYGFCSTSILYTSHV